MIDSTSFMLRHGLKMLQNGYSVLPIVPGEKRPGVYGAGTGWTGMREWSTFCEEPASQRMVERWCGWPDACVGIACGNVVGIDVDCPSSDNLGQLGA